MNQKLCLLICFFVGVLVFYLLKNTCGCGSVVEGNGTCINISPNPQGCGETVCNSRTCDGVPWSETKEKCEDTNGNCVHLGSTGTTQTDTNVTKEQCNSLSGDKQFVTTANYVIQHEDQGTCVYEGGSCCNWVQSDETSFYFQVDLNVELTNPPVGKKHNRFMMNFFQDIADALNIDKNQVMIVPDPDFTENKTPPHYPISFKVFADTFDQAQILRDSMLAQLNDGKSKFRNGFVSDNIVNPLSATVGDVIELPGCCSA